MKILISPAKSLNFNVDTTQLESSNFIFAKESQQLINKLSKLSKQKLSELMKLSPQLTDLNYNRYKAWNLPFDTSNAKQAATVFTGEVYKGLDFNSLSNTAIQTAQKQLRILSGLYGLLKPLDLIQPYRLEMGTKLNYSTTKKNLYQFWGNKITNALNNELEEDEVVVNLASNEYFKSIQSKEVNAKIITCNFKELKGDKYKIVMMYAKNARGKMSRFILENNIEKVEHLKTFEEDGYFFNTQLSSDNEFIFTRG